MTIKTKSFSSAMPGTPVLSGTAGSLIALLDAVLVNGFGLQSVSALNVLNGIATATVPAAPGAAIDAVILVAGASNSLLNGEQRVTSVTANSVSWATTASNGAVTGTITLKVAPAGWVKSFSDSGVAAYKSLAAEATGCYLRIDDTGTTAARVRGYEAMSNISTGSGLFPSAAQYAGSGLWWSKSSVASATAVPWRIHADDRGFYFFVQNIALGEYQGNYFGDILSLKSGDPYACALRANVSDRSAATGGTFGDDLVMADGASAFDGLYLARAANTLGGALRASSTPVMSLGVASAHITGSVGFSYPAPVDNGLMLTPVLLYHAGQGPRGYFPGLRFSPQVVNTSFATGDVVAGSGDMVGEKVHAVRLGASVSLPTQCGVVFLDTISDWR